jgi:PAS domain S-box-containing protein
MTDTHVQTGTTQIMVAAVCGAVALIASTIVAGWLLDVSPLTGAPSGRPLMEMSTAVGALLTAAGLWLLREERRGRVADIVGIACGVVATAIGVLAIWDAATGLALAPGLPGEPDPSRAEPAMALASALMLTAAGSGVLLLRQPRRLASQCCGGVVAVVGIFTFQMWLTSLITGSAIHSALDLGPLTIAAFLLLAFGLLAARGREGVFAPFTLRTAGGRIGRRLWLPLVLLTISMGVVLEWAQVHEWIDSSTESALLVVWISLVASLLVWLNARSFTRLDEQLGRSIDQRAIAEQTLRRQASLFDQAYEGMVISQVDGPIALWNRGAERLYGFTRDEAVGRLSNELLSTTVTGGLPLMAEQLKRNRHWEGELHHQHRDGHELIVDTRMMLVTDEQGTFVVSASRDITERVRAETALRESERRFREIAEWLPQLVWTCEPDGWCDFLSQRWLDYTGSTLVKEVGYGWLNQIHPDDQARLMTAWMASVETGTEFRIEFRIRRHDGVYRWFDTRALPLRGASDRIVKWFGSNTDIEDERAIREALRSNEERLAMALAITDTAVWDFDLAAQQVTRSLEHDRIFGYESLQPDWTFDRFIGHIIPEDRDRMRRRFERTMTSAVDDWSFDCRIKRADGELRWIAVRGRSKRGDHGQVRWLSGVVQDVTTRKTIEEEILRLNTDLEGRVEQRTQELAAANRELEAFSYSVSHDLRAPLRTIDGFSQAVLEDYSPALPIEGQRYLKVIREGAQRMGRLIDDLLAFSRLSRQPLNARPVDMHALASDAWQEVLSQQRREAEVLIEQLPGSSGDPSLLRQVWLNLLSNALKYSRGRAPARVHVGSVREHDRDVYFVRDNGTGFDMQYAHKLFGVFQRLHRSDDFEGTGVGLAVVQRIVHRHGGRIWAEAAVDQGATFYFTIEPDRGSRGEQPTR